VKIRRFTDTGEWTTRRYLSLLGSILIWIIVAIDAWYLWPTQLGGSTSMVIVSGVSMEPTYFSGDLVISRKIAPEVGDVIVYAPASLGGPQVVHRIIGGNATDGWQMQGDNNNFVDPFTPKGDEVRGVVLVHYANFGRVTVLLLNPIVWALMLIAAIVLLVWWSGDTCEDDPDDDDECRTTGEGDPESDADEEPDLIDRVVDGAEAAVARMVAAGADMGAAALGALTRSTAAPRHAAVTPRRGAPVLLRSSVIVSLLGLLAIYAPSIASASQLTVTPGHQVSVVTDTKCATQTLAATPTGTNTSNSYTQVTVSGISAACLNEPITVYLHNSAGAVIATFTGTTPTTGTTMTLTLSSGTYNATLVTKAVAQVKGWLFVPTWSYTAGPPPFPAPFQCDGILLTTGQLVTGTTCTFGGTLYYTYLGRYAGTWTYYANVNPTTAFNPTGYLLPNGTWVDYQAITKWRYTINLTTMNGSGNMGDLYNGFYIYKNGNNTVLAPGETCSDPASVTFQEDVAGTNPSSSFIVSPRALSWMTASDLLCQGP